MTTSVHFVITGCARSGTGYTAALLTALGIECTHEQVFGPNTTMFSSFGSARGDASWLAMPFLGQLPEQTPVLHQIREPREVIESLLSIAFFRPGPDGTLTDDLRSGMQVLRTRGMQAFKRLASPRRHRARGRRLRRDFVAFVARHTPEVFEHEREQDRAIQYWLSWNDAIRRASSRREAHLRFRLEDVDEELVDQIGALVRVTLDPIDVKNRLHEVPRSTNSRASVRKDAPPLSEASTAMLDALRRGSRSYGYELELD